jgi:alkylhydroperoxidase family enzyme
MFMEPTSDLSDTCVELQRKVARVDGGGSETAARRSRRVPGELVASEESMMDGVQHALRLAADGDEHVTEIRQTRS